MQLLNERYKNELALFEEADEQVEECVNRFWNEMITTKTIDRKAMEENHRLVKADTIKHKEARDIGTDPYLSGHVASSFTPMHSVQYRAFVCLATSPTHLRLV